jgi:tRNA threonylcarbamoyl adenosine modification protein YeaZ
MRILSIETSGRDASLAVLEASVDEAARARLVRQESIVSKERTAQVLAARLHDLLLGVDWPVQSVELVLVAVGPGSFTGLRIGVTTAKTLAYSIGAQVLGVNTLAAIAERAPTSCRPLWAVMDAQRQEIFACRFAPDGSASSTRVFTQDEWFKSLQSGDFVSGPGLRRLKYPLPTAVQAVDEALWLPMADAVGQLGWRDYQAGRRDDVWSILPQYYRSSAAEEKKKASS